MPENRAADREASRDRADLEYDLAHEAASVDPDTNAEAIEREPAEPATRIVNETEDYDGDYGYDLAHDLPGPTREPERGPGDRRS